MTVHALVLAEVEAGYALQATENLHKLDSVGLVLLTAGPYDLAIIVEADNNAALGQLIVNEYQRVPGIKSTLTLVGLGDLSVINWMVQS